MFLSRKVLRGSALHTVPWEPSGLQQGRMGGGSVPVPVRARPQGSAEEIGLSLLGSRLSIVYSGP